MAESVRRHGGRTTERFTCARPTGRRAPRAHRGAISQPAESQASREPGGPAVRRSDSRHVLRQGASPVATGADPEFDLVILGGGSGGYACALRAAELGMNVALVERDKLGGTCLHRGCIPTKALLHAGEIADQTRESEQFGIKAELVGVDMKGVSAYKGGVVDRLYKGLQGLMKSAKGTYVEGEGRLVA